MFKFNFQPEKDNFILEEKDVIEKRSNACYEVCYSTLNPDIKFKTIDIAGIAFLVRDVECNSLETEFEFLKSYKDCDVVPSVYEGGLKVWECTFDLLSFLIRTRMDFTGKNVLDLGCGCGLLGILAGFHGAEIVHFQDYNKEVLSYATIPNVMKNNIKSRIKFFSGDWSAFAFSKLTSDTKYDVILSSETLYNPRSYSNLMDVFSEKLSEGGQIILASKSYYFGVGGSVKQFQDFLTEQTNLVCHSIWATIEGVQREILVLEKMTN